MTATFYRLNGTSFPYTLQSFHPALDDVWPDRITLVGEHSGTYAFTGDADAPIYTEIQPEP
jgi:hypothetical protein